MWRRGRGALAGVAVAWTLAVGCGDRTTVTAGPDAALRRDLQLAAATAVALAAAPDDSAPARFLPASVESGVERAAPVRVRPATAARRRPAARRAATVATPPAVVPSAQAQLEALAAASAEPQPERIARFADQEGIAGYAAGYGVALRGGAVGDDHCERDLPRRSPGPRTTAVSYRPAMARLGGVPQGPRPGLGPLHAPPF